MALKTPLSILSLYSQRNPVSDKQVCKSDLQQESPKHLLKMKNLGLHPRSDSFAVYQDPQVILMHVKGFSYLPLMPIILNGTAGIEDGPEISFKRHPGGYLGGCWLLG